MDVHMEQLLNTIIQDMKASIHYTPDKDADLVRLMHNYVEAQPASRSYLLHEILACINDQPYDNPYLGVCYYTASDIDAFERMMLDYLDNLHSDDKPVSSLVVLIHKINQLQEQCNNYLIDDWRAQRLESLLSSTMDSYEYAMAIISSEKRW